ncbi:MAG: hypothetical protein JRN67_01555, partial [Nitrososphaerota archaeon]|nr:hypothetical protein [Nitrososphaerota archaeon]
MLGNHFGADRGYGDRKETIGPVGKARFSKSTVFQIGIRICEELLVNSRGNEAGLWGFGPQTPGLKVSPVRARIRDKHQ